MRGGGSSKLQRLEPTTSTNVVTEMTFRPRYRHADQNIHHLTYIIGYLLAHTIEGGVHAWRISANVLSWESN